MPLSNKAINFVTSFLFFQIAHFETGDNFWRFMALFDSDDEMGEVEGENMLPTTLFVESNVTSCIDITLGG